MDELENLAIRECALSGAEGVLFHELMDEMGRRCGNPISRPLQTLLWRRVRLLACLDFARDAPDREMQLKDEKRRVFEAEESDTSINQRELFLNLEMLLRMKQGSSSSESKEVIIAGNSTRMKIPEITV